MNQNPQNNKAAGVFPTPVYIVNRNLNLSFEEKTDIEDIIKKGMTTNIGNTISTDNYIFNSKLKKIKQFCDLQIQGYIEEVITPKEDIEIYITQSWLNVTKPGGYHHEHRHSNSILSGVFYVETEKGDHISFVDPNAEVKDMIKFEQREWNMWNSITTTFDVVENELVLFPSWLHHQVRPNEIATKDRISLAFNTFVRGTLGDRKSLTELFPDSSFASFGLPPDMRKKE
jgi:uncharacterized protein (TIGR02466 family)